MRITRRQSLGLLGAAMTVPAIARASADYSLTPVEVADQLWLLEGARDDYSQSNGGAAVNTALVGTNAGMVVIDTGPSQSFGTAVRRVANELSGQGIAAVINTHHHGGHMLGNQVFNEVPIYAMGRTIELAEQTADATLLEMRGQIGDWVDGTTPIPPNTALPDGVLSIGDRRLEVLPLKGHCQSDLALIDGTTGVLIAGDIVFHDRAPIADTADFDAWLGALDILEQTGSSAILPGHGPFDPEGTSIVKTRRYLEWLLTRLNSAVALGLDAETTAGIGQPEDIAKLGAMPQEYERAVAANLPKLDLSRGVGSDL